jgi:hypothetical protein
MLSRLTYLLLVDQHTSAFNLSKSLDWIFLTLNRLIEKEYAELNSINNFHVNITDDQILLKIKQLKSINL